jgi:hydrogenase expression/formation protein HypC
MCMGIPGEIVDVAKDGSGLATVDMVGVRRTVDVGLLVDVAPRDWVLVHVGFALTKLDEAEARATLAMLEALG